MKIKKFLRKSNIDISKLFAFIGWTDFSILIINSIYHFIIHGFYKSFLGIIFLLLFGIGLSIIIIFDQLHIKIAEETVIFFISFLGALSILFVLGVLIATMRITFPIFLVLQWALVPLCFTIICTNENI